MKRIRFTFPLLTILFNLLSEGLKRCTKRLANIPCLQPRQTATAEVPRNDELAVHAIQKASCSQMVQKSPDRKDCDDRGKGPSGVDIIGTLEVG